MRCIKSIEIDFDSDGVLKHASEAMPQTDKHTALDWSIRALPLEGRGLSAGKRIAANKLDASANIRRPEAI
jgi:hypothetical protein